MKRDGVIPDLIDVAPKELLNVTYPSGAKPDLGNELSPTSVKDTPALKWNAHPPCFYTLIFVDLDVPSRKDPQLREFKHWLVGNIPGDDLSKGETFASYIGSGPDRGTGLHRCVFLVYRQPGRIVFAEKRVPNNSTEDRPNFSTRTFAKRYDLGEPLAGNYYQAQYDDYVPTLRRQLGL